MPPAWVPNSEPLASAVVDAGALEDGSAAGLSSSDPPHAESGTIAAATSRPARQAERRRMGGRPAVESARRVGADSVRS